jgi:hypothetical protein
MPVPRRYNEGVSVGAAGPITTNAAFPAGGDRRGALVLARFFSRAVEEETPGEATLVKIGEAMDDRGLKKKHPMITVAATPRNTSGMAVVNDK